MLSAPDNTDFTVFLYMPLAEIADQLRSSNEIKLLPTYQAWEGLGIFGLGYSECKTRLFLNPSSILVDDTRHISGREFAKAVISREYHSGPVSIRITNAERRRILRQVTETQASKKSTGAVEQGIRFEIFQDPSYYYTQLPSIQRVLGQDLEE